MTLTAARPVVAVLSLLLPTIACLQSTGVHDIGHLQAEGPYRVQHVEDYFIVHFPAPCSIAHTVCGTPIACKKSRIRPKYIISISWPPPSHQGYAGFCVSIDKVIFILGFSPSMRRLHETTMTKFGSLNSICGFIRFFDNCHSDVFHFLEQISMQDWEMFLLELHQVSFRLAHLDLE